MDEQQPQNIPVVPIEPQNNFLKWFKYILYIVSGIVVLYSVAVVSIYLIASKGFPPGYGENDLILNSSTTTDQLADWQTYTNQQYGFEFEYPANSQIEGKNDNLWIVDSQNANIFSLQIFPIKAGESVESWINDYSDSGLTYSIVSTSTEIINGYETFQTSSNSSVSDSFYAIKNKNYIFLFNDAGIDPKEILSTFKFISTSTPIAPPTTQTSTTVNCTDEACFTQKFAACVPATYTADTSFASFSYNIIGPKTGGCSMTVKYPKNPNPDWVNKDMTCVFNNKLALQASVQDVFARVSNGTLVCLGPLYTILKNQ